MHLECERCKGVGQVIKNPCVECKATGILSQRVTERISVPPGAENGQSLTIPEKVGAILIRATRAKTGRAAT